MLNVLMNHGYLPRNGSKVSKSELSQVLENKAGFAGTGSFLDSLPRFKIGNKGDEDISFAEVSVANKLEHVASMVHPEHYHGNYLKPDPKLLKQLYSMSKNGKDLSLVDLAKFRLQRFKDCKRDSPSQCILSLKVYAFGYSEAAFLATFLADDDYLIKVDDLIAYLEREQFPQGWKVKNRSQLFLIGMTFRLVLYSWVPYETIVHVVKIMGYIHYKINDILLSL